MRVNTRNIRTVFATAVFFAAAASASAAISATATYTVTQAAGGKYHYREDDVPVAEAERAGESGARREAVVQE